ncbi:CHAT domain-containing protein [Streptacidiphilus sp. N1-3]|uniref:CHAT domain-containing protein n=1 Tax=Streptacidiphilus alkalitolerans TaxID=3342712 RepID=A0ABV6WY02_9ACTN
MTDTADQGDPDRAIRRVTAEASQAWQTFLTGSEPALENEAIALATQAVELAEHTPDVALAGQCHLNLGSMLASRFDRLAIPADLTSSERHIARALALLPADHHDRPGCYSTAGASSFRRFQLDSRPETLDLSISQVRCAVSTATVDDPRLNGFRSNLAAFLTIRHAVTGEDADLDEAVALGRAVAASYRGPQRPLVLGAFLGSLIHLINRRTDLAALTEAQTVVHEILAVTGPGSPHRIAVLGNVTALLRLQHLLVGVDDGAALDQAVPLQRELLDAVPTGHIEEAVHICTLADLLVLRWQTLASREDLEEAVRLLERSSDLPASRFIAHFGASYTVAMRALAESRLADGSPRAAAEAAVKSVDAARQLRKGAADHPLLAGRAAILEANAWLTLHQATGGDEALTAAEACFVEADESLLPDDPQRAVLFGNIAFARLDALQNRASGEELGPVITTLRKSVAMFNDTTRFSEAGTRALSNLGSALLFRYEADRNQADLEESLILFLEIAESDKAPWRVRLGVCSLAAHSLMNFSRPVLAVQWYERAMQLLPLTAWRGADRSGAESLLGAYTSLGRDAAAALLDTGHDPGQALSVLEAGRGVLWARTVELRGNATDVQRWNPELAGRLADLGRRLDSVDHPSGLDELPDAASRRTDRRAVLSQEYRTLAAEAAATGHGGFLTPPSTTDLQAAAVDGPVIVVNVSKWRCDAFLVTAAGIDYLPLPKLTADAVERMASEHLAALAALDAARAERVTAQAANATAPSLSSARREHAARTAEAEAARHSGDLLDSILRDLWDFIAEPITNALALDGAARLWWCPTGPLALLPLHAAGHYAPLSAPCIPETPGMPNAVGSVANQPRNLLDRFTCSITPTVLSLARAHRVETTTGGATSADPRMLMVALPDTPGQNPLPEVERERDLLRSLWPEGRLTCLEGPDAACAAVRAALHTHSLAHIGCHGRQDTKHPSIGGILLYDGLLSVGDIASGRHNGEFAFLSACETVTIGRALPDEVISLGAALHVTGYRHVIGTQWSVNSTAAADASETVHLALTAPGGVFHPSGAADALRRAVLRLRADPALPRYSWVPFTHTGP